MSGDVRLPALELKTHLTFSETDGLRLLERQVQRREILLTFSTTPDVSPVLLATRAKGRLQHACRTTLETSVDFSRKLAVRAVGENRTATVESYIRSQAVNEHFVDERFANVLKQFTVIDSAVDRSVPSESGSGRYWYKLHLVLVVDGRCRVVDEPGLAGIRDGCWRIAEKKGYWIAALSVMPDHLHLALRGKIEQSPAEIALAFQNNLAHVLKRGAIWMNGYYAGTFGEYDMNAIRVKIEQVARSRCQIKGVDS